MEIEFNWSIAIGDSKFTGSATVNTFEQLETLNLNLKKTVEILTPTPINQDNLK